MAIAKKPPSKIQLFLMKVLDELNLFTNDDIIRNIVPPIRAMPGSPKTKEMPGLGENPAESTVAAVNRIVTISGVFKSFLKKVTAKKNMEIGILKY